MPIGAIIGGVASVGGALLSSSSSNKQAKAAAATSQANTDANVNLAREVYGQNRDLLNPFVQRGNAAGNAMNALLGLGGAPMEQGGPAIMQMPATQPNALSQFYGTGASGPAIEGSRPPSMYTDVGLPYGLGDGFISTGSFNNGVITGNPQNALQAPTQTSQTAQQAAEGAFDTFRNSTGYQFRLGEGLDAVNSAYAGIGGFQSGAAMRGINEYGQNFASNEFGNYMNALGGQQAVGAGAASSVAGVGQNFAGTVIGQNNINAQNQMGAQLGQQNVFGNALGAIGGGILGYGR